MNKLEPAKLLNVSRNTLNNWKKEKPLINQGSALDDQIEEVRKHLKRLEEKANSNKFQLK